MDEVLEQAMEPVLRDLRSARLVAPRIEDVDWTGDREFPSVMLWGSEGSGVGVSVARSAQVSERVASMADQVQEWAIEELWGQASTNWPACPQHPNSHPLEATTLAGSAVWVCAADGALISKIGML